MDSIRLYPAAVVLAAGIIAAVTDVRSLKIYNRLTLPLLVSGVLYHAIAFQANGVVDSLAGAMLGGGVLLIAFLLGGMGAGDVKLMAGVGAWIGLRATFYVLCASSLAAGAYALILLAQYGGGRRVINNLWVIIYQMRAISSHLGSGETTESLVEVGDRHRLIPFGAMILVGISLWILWWGAKL